MMKCESCSAFTAINWGNSKNILCETCAENLDAEEPQKDNQFIPLPDGIAQKVTVTNVDISFLNLVWLLVKFSFAVIPALIIISIFIMIGTTLLSTFGVYL